MCVNEGIRSMTAAVSAVNSTHLPSCCSSLRSAEKRTLLEQKPAALILSSAPKKKKKETQKDKVKEREREG